VLLPGASSDSGERERRKMNLGLDGKTALISGGSKGTFLASPRASHLSGVVLNLGT
jgi:hypothetical protein